MKLLKKGWSGLQLGWRWCWWDGVQVWMLAALCRVVASSSSSVESHECNQTINMADLEQAGRQRSLTFSMPAIGRSERGRPFYCWFRFEGTQAQYVSVDVTDLKVGGFNEGSGTCEGGYLRISDSDTCSTDPTWFPPTEICGEFKPSLFRVKRYTRSPMAFVEYRVDKAKKTKSYQFDVTFLDIASDDSLPYGHLQKKKGRVQNTKCDWLIDVDECIGHCEVQSPGYPGIYPPSTRCRYLFVSFTDARVHLQMGGLGFSGKMDMKQSENCSTSDDYVEVFDGMSAQSSSFGRFCGHEGYHLVSSGEGLLLLFQSGVGGPPWTYTGFDVRVTDRWKNEHEGGTLVPGTICNWVFESRDLIDGEGNAHTPDHMLDNGTTCVFEFRGLPNERLELEIVVRNLEPDCNEYLEIYDSDKPSSKICAVDIADRGKKNFYFNLTSPSASVHYVRHGRQISNVKPSWIYFEFYKVPEVEVPEAGVASARDVVAESKLPGSGTSLMTSIMMLMVTSLMTSAWNL